LVLTVVSLSAGCTGGGSGTSGSGPLSEDECRQLITKIQEVSYAGLSTSDRAEVEDSPEELAASVQECVSEQDWKRPGYECVMKATSESDLKRCIFENR
jgi:hypothetical protein